MWRWTSSVSFINGWTSTGIFRRAGRSASSTSPITVSAQGHISKPASTIGLSGSVTFALPQAVGRGVVRQGLPRYVQLAQQGLGPRIERGPVGAIVSLSAGGRNTAAGRWSIWRGLRKGRAAVTSGGGRVGRGGIQLLREGDRRTRRLMPLSASSRRRSRRSTCASLACTARSR